MKWEAFYEPWDVISDRRMLLAMCLLFEKVHVSSLQYGRDYPTDVDKIEQFEAVNYPRSRLGTPEGRKAVETWHRRISAATTLRPSLEDVIELDRTLLLEYAKSWYPFFNYITPLAEGDDPVLVSIPEEENLPFDLLTLSFHLETRLKTRSLEDIRKFSRISRQLNIQASVRRAASKDGGVCVSDQIYAPLDRQDLLWWQKLAPLLALRCTTAELPLSPSVHPEEILEARSMLATERIAFREAALGEASQLAKLLVTQGQASEKAVQSLLEVTSVEIRAKLADLEARIRTARKGVLRKLVAGAGGPIGLSSVVASLLTSQWWLAAGGLAIQAGMTLAKNRETVKETRRESGLSFLLSVREKFHR